MIHVHEKKYEYFEEANEGILKQFIPACPGTGQAVLDVGCGSGALSGAITKLGYTVWGIESYGPASLEAGQRISKVITGDLTDLSFVGAAIGGMKFDHIIFSDVLEHLYDPFSVLKGYMPFLKDGGRVLVSVPNALVWENRLKMFFGILDYSDTGVMDRTHIRFFTFKTAKEVVRAAGCEILKVDYTPYFTRAALPFIKSLYNKGGTGCGAAVQARRSIAESPYFKFYMRYIYPVEYVIGLLRKQLFGFRIIIVGKKI